ncbi:putative serine/threonine-protein kinase atr [Apostichopus japonicus]|uniref:Putative serine/threonine-protein kinase atr n=1 Tax=Stichopus japonicus TaxID=307972 RepID=A0A2G8L5G2_STIJA|nr:putative serine/threonine-protein kinase atr [Apostichopus japonicus]
MTSNSAGSSGTKVSSTQMMLKEVEQALSILDDKKLSAAHPTFVQAQESLRRHVCEQTRTRLTDLDKVAAELAKDSSAPGQSQVILDFLLFLMSRNPVTFTSNMSSDSEQKNLLDFQICKDLDKWLLARLLHILTDFQCKSIHLKVCDVIWICNIFSEKFNHGAIEILEEPVVLEVFPWQPDQSNRPASQEGSFDFTAVFAESKPVTLEHLSSCYLLQFNMSNILKKMVQDGGIFLAKHTGFLWALLCCQLEQGHLPIKEVSLHLMGSLLEQGNNPPVELQEYFADLLVGSLNLILVSHQDDPFVEVQEDFEESLARCLDALFIETSTGKPSICSMQSLLEMLLEVIAETIPQNGLDSV